MKSNSTLPLISIIVPVYNVKDYVGKCLLSLQGQTYPNLEIIVVDDGSTDGSGDICDSFARLDSRFKVIHRANGGQSAARNEGLDVATGEYIGFVDSDDWIDTDMYEFLYQLMIDNNADISVCSHYIEKNGKAKIKYASEDTIVFTRKKAIRALVEDKRMRNYVWDKLYKRHLFENLHFPVNRFFEDIALSYQIFHRAKKIVMQGCPKYHYLVREGSTMQSKYDPIKEHHLFLSVYEQNKFVEKKNLWEKAPIYVLQRGIRLIDHTMMLRPSPLTDDIVEDVLTKMHEYDHIKLTQLGLAFSIKRFFIYKHMALYRLMYRFVRVIFKPRRYKY